MAARAACSSGRPDAYRGSSHQCRPPPSHQNPGPQFRKPLHGNQPSEANRLIRSKIGSVHSRLGPSPDLPPDLCVVPIRPQSAPGPSLANPLASSRGETPRCPVANGPAAQGRPRPEQRKPCGSDRPQPRRTATTTAIVLSARRNDPLDANYTQSQVWNVIGKVDMFRRKRLALSVRRRCCTRGCTAGPRQQQ